MHARIVNGRVAEIFPASDTPLAERFHPALVAAMVEAGPEVQPGWLWDGVAFTPPPPPPPAPPPPAPMVIALWQFRRELRARGWWEDVQAAIAALPAEQRADAEEWLEYGTEVRRDAPLLLALAGALGLTEELEAAFTAAAARTL
ncbi:MAG: hypothetical protein K5Q68_15105 [Roseococcus sp.]|nr:hypothetical protein [Roseococcus sp.]